MKKVLIFTVLLFIIVDFVLIRATKSPIKTITPTPEPTISAEKLMSIVNDWRYAQGLQPYTKNKLTCDFAEKRLPEIQVNWSHDGFSGKRECGNLECWAGENLSSGYGTEKETLDAWLKSPEHRANLDANYQYSCIKCDNNYCVQEFANL